MITTVTELQEGVRRAERLVELLDKRISLTGQILGVAGARLDADELMAVAEEIRSYLGTK